MYSFLKTCRFYIIIIYIIENIWDFPLKRTSLFDSFHFGFALRGIFLHVKFHAGVEYCVMFHTWKIIKAVNLGA